MSREKTSPKTGVSQSSLKEKSSGLPGLEFSRQISLERILRWDTAKKFWSEKKEELGCSYNRYAVIEKGTAKASLELAKRIIKALDIAEDSGLYAWVRDLMPDEQSRSYFSDPYTHEKIAKNPTLYLDRARIDLFRDTKFSYEIALYISIYTYRGVSEDEICKIFQLGLANLRLILNALIFRRVIFKNKEGHYEVPEDAWIHIPNLPDFRRLRTKLTIEMIESHFSSPYSEMRSIEYRVLKRLTQSQIELIRLKGNTFLSWLGMLPDEPGAITYRCIFGGNLASFGNARKKLFKEDRVIEADTAWGQSNE